MELYIIGEYLAAVQRQGNTKNGNPVYIVNFFKSREGNRWENCNMDFARSTDKYGNLKFTSYNISDDLKYFLK